MTVPFRLGDRVRLARLDHGFLDGVEAGDRERLHGLVGEAWTVEGMRHATGEVEIVFSHPPGSATPLDWLWVPPHFVERMD